MKGKYYKPGQLVTIEDKVYRIKRKRERVLACNECTIVSCYEVCAFCNIIPPDCYLEPVKPKQK